MLDAVKEWGLNGDGEADSTDAFLRMREAFLGDRDRMWEVEFRPGRYLTRAPDWLDGVGHVRLIGYGATLQQIIRNYGLFSTSEPFRTLTWTEPFRQPITTHHAGYRIVSVEAGRTRLAFVDGAAPPAAPGAVVFIAGRNQQFQNLHLPEDQWQINGWPPNLRHFEFAAVRQASNNFVELQRPLAHNYDAAWRDYPGDYFGAYVAGAPRLYLCDRTDWRIPRSIEFYGFTFLRARDSEEGADHIGFPPAVRLCLEDCTIEPGGFLQLADELSLLRCTYNAPLEIDKCLRHVLIEDCDIAGLTSDGAGNLELEVRRSRIYGDFRVNPRTSVLIDNVTAFRNFSLNAQHGGYYDTDPFRMVIRATRP
jgi:hypothetical protein